MSEPLAYDVKRSRRRTIALHVLPGGRLEVRAPFRASDRTLSDFVASKRAWVERTLRRQADPSRRVLWTDRPLSTGDVVHLRGVPHTLVLSPGEGRAAAACQVARNPASTGDLLLVPVHGGTDDARRRILELYRADLDLRLRAMMPDAARKVGRTPSAVSFRLARTRWGSCGRTGRISLNLLCAALPDALLEYVLCHELCHLRYLDHGRAFWATLASVLPDQASRRRELRGWYLQAPI
jgi:predicted metal-dependent hydrolase